MATGSLVVICTVDENGDRVFTDEDVEAVGRKSANALDTIVSAARELNAPGEEDVEELSKNSKPSGDEDSTLE